MSRLYRLTAVPFRQPGVWLLLLALGLIGLHFNRSPHILDRLKAETLYDFTLSMTFDAQDADVSIATFLPQSDERQEILRETIRSSELQFDDRVSSSGRYGVWVGQDVNEVRYESLIALQAVKFDLDEALLIPPVNPDLSPYLQPTEAIQVQHPEITRLWQQIEPNQINHLRPVLKSIYDYVYTEMGFAPFKGYTDALTALRLNQASCNGKSRLFVAMARLNNIPSRLVGGIILKDETKKTSHQWVEVHVEGHWVPVDPTNGHFGELPANYLKLYTGDEVLFTHTSNINFDYRFMIDLQQTASALFRFEDRDQNIPSLNAAELMKFTGLSEKVIGVFLMFPLATLITVFLRNVIGLKTFGIFMPMLIAAASVQTGLFMGIMVFGGVVLFAFLGQLWLGQFRLLKIPRLAAVITLVTILFIVLLFYFGGKTSFELGVLALFPVVIISFLAERIHNMVEDRDWRGVSVSVLGTTITIAACFVAFSSVTFQGLFALLPELFVAVLALQIMVGSWTGMRLLEYFRFRTIIHDGPVMGINKRNVDFINKLNTNELLKLASDKIATKERLRQFNIPVADDLAICRSHRDLASLMDVIDNLDSFALKPNRGSQGNGILIAFRIDDDNFRTPGGRPLTKSEIARHVCEILAGSFSQDGVEDVAYIEPVLRQHPDLNAMADLGLSDVRIILHKHEIVAAMLRLPTSQSDGKANLHQGAVGLSIDPITGIITHASLKGRSVRKHPDTAVELIGAQIPLWTDILSVATESSLAVPLGYIGVDICIDATHGPMVLEVNGRPGIEIQNVQKKGLFDQSTKTEFSYA